MNSDAGAQESDSIDFDKIDNGEMQGSELQEYELALEEDALNLGFWLWVKHPNFFEGSCNARFRYAIWLFSSIIIFLAQWKLNTSFLLEAIGDY